LEIVAELARVQAFLKLLPEVWRLRLQKRARTSRAKQPARFARPNKNRSRGFGSSKPLCQHDHASNGTLLFTVE
jgi:hypothetical protein